MPFPSGPTTGAGVQHLGGSVAPPPSRLKPLLFDKEIVDWEKDLYPSASIVMKNSRKTKASPVWSRWERKPYPHWITLTSAHAAATATWTSGTDLSAADFARVTPGDVYMNVRTREIIRVASFSTTFALNRSFGDVPATLGAVGDKLVKVGSSFAEGSTAPAAHFVLEDEVLFTAQESSLTCESTARILGTRFAVDPNRRQSQIEQKRIEFTEGIKRSLFAGGGSTLQDVSGGSTYNEVTGVKGLIDHCDTWTYNFNGILTRPDFFGYIGDGPGRYIKGDIGIAMSSFGLNIVNNWLMDDPTKQNSDMSSLGYNVDMLKLVAGRRAKLFYESWLDEDPTTQGWFFVFPLNKNQGSSFIEVVGPEWNGRVQLNKNVKTEDSYKGIKDEWYAFYGWEHGPEICYGFGYGITG